MEFVIGGACQGKQEFACRKYKLKAEEIIDGSAANREQLLNCRAVRDFHLYIKAALKRGEDADTLCENLLAENPDVIIISNEIGYGIVPMDPEDRFWREKTGRVSCRIAAASRNVYRVCMGIGTAIKETDQ
ncbi:MAG: bifunctional adenosylcobinamide kinase/adenosylcobinamide-phosphate guanylyltransferase [Eubacteriales bacterium]|nr:bifunctional adenosylcobinamide kinase/adenosylcobinamide-phosphate guanylyltransferase [Eubacteriales bacterium]